jgi:hypothetical protein
MTTDGMWLESILDYSKHRQACRLISGEGP